MDEKEVIRNQLDEVFKILNENMEKSYILIENNPQITEEVVNMWSDYVQKMIGTATQLSEKYNNKKIVKKITKTLIFGR